MENNGNVNATYEDRYQQFSSFWRDWKVKNENQQTTSMNQQIQQQLTTPDSMNPNSSKQPLLANFQRVRTLEKKHLLRSVQDRELMEHLNNSKAKKQEDYYVVDPTTGKLLVNENFFQHQMQHAKKDLDTLFEGKLNQTTPLDSSFLQQIEERNQQRQQQEQQPMNSYNSSSAFSQQRQQDVWSQRERRRAQRNLPPQKPKKLSFRQKQQLEQQANLKKWIQTQWNAILSTAKQIWKQFMSLFSSSSASSSSMNAKQLFEVIWNILKTVLQKIVSINPFMRAQMIAQQQQQSPMMLQQSPMNHSQEGYRNSMVYYRNYSG